LSASASDGNRGYSGGPECAAHGIVAIEQSGSEGTVEGVAGGGGIDGANLMGGQGNSSAVCESEKTTALAEFQEDVARAASEESFSEVGEFVFGQVLGIEIQEGASFRFIRREPVDAFEKRGGERLGRGGIEDERNAFPAGNSGEEFNGFERGFQLCENDAGAANHVQMFFDVAGRDVSVCAGDDDDYVFAVRGGDDLGDTGGSGFDFDGGGVYASGFEIGAEFAAERIVAKFSDHADLRAEPGGGEGLIGAFAAGERSETGAGQGFAGKRNPEGNRDKIEIDASNDDEALIHFIRVPKLSLEDQSPFLQIAVSRYFEMTGASATAAKPTTKNKNINGISLRAFAGALANSFQTKTPQMAETMVAPCPMA
jgi:hypothetical protein